MHGSIILVRLFVPVVAAACLEASLSSKLPSFGGAHSLGRRAWTFSASWWWCFLWRRSSVNFSRCPVLLGTSCPWR